MPLILLKLKLSLMFILLVSPLTAWSQTPEQIAFLYDAGKETVEQSADLANLVTRAVEFASRPSGVLTTQGLIREVHPGNTFVYTSEPGGLLTIEFLDGQVIEFTITELSGQNYSSPTAFLRSDHVLRFECEWTGGPHPLSVSVYSIQSGGQRQGYTRGQMTLRNQLATVNLALVGSSSFVSDLSGVEYRTDYTWAGKVETPTMTVHVDETRDFDLVVVRARNERTQSAHSSRVVLNSSALIGADRLAFHNAQVQTAFRNGTPSDVDYWAGNSGQLVYNQTQVGEIKALYEYPYAKIQLLLTDGTAVDLQRWLLDPDAGPR